MIVRSLRGRWREDVPHSTWRWLLFPAWLLYRPIVALRNCLFDLNLRRATRVAMPVWSVGNLTAGGTGKTPLTRHLATWAQHHGRHPAILTRGYRASADGTNDEVKLIDSCPVIANPDRIAGADQATTQGADCLILDDGFQHRRLHRDLDIVLIDATRPFGDVDQLTGHILPLGYLRESRRALRRADVIAISRMHLVSKEFATELESHLGAFGKPIIHIVDDSSELCALHNPDEKETVTSVAKRPVILCSGLGNPLGFERTAIAHGWDVRESWRFPDHYHYTRDDIESIITHAASLSATVIITGKDAVKWRDLIPNEQASAIKVLQVSSAIAAADQQLIDDALLRTLSSQPSPS